MEWVDVLDVWYDAEQLFLSYKWILIFKSLGSPPPNRYSRTGGAPDEQTRRRARRHDLLHAVQTDLVRWMCRRGREVWICIHIQINKLCDFNRESQWDIALTILKMLLLYAIPLTFMSFAYYQIVKVLWSSANIPGNSTTSTVTSSGRRQTVVVNSNGSSHHNGQCQAQCKNQIHLLPQYYLRTYY